MGGATTLHEPGNSRFGQQYCNRQPACRGSLTTQPTLLRSVAPTPRLGARSCGSDGDMPFLGAAETLHIECVLGLQAVSRAIQQHRDNLEYNVLCGTVRQGLYEIAWDGGGDQHRSTARMHGCPVLIRGASA